MSPELAYHIYRPSIKSIHTMSDDERTQLVASFKASFDDFDPETMYMQKDKSFYDVHAPDSFQKEIKNIIWKNITPELFTLFWTLSLEHIYVPVER